MHDKKAFLLSLMDPKPEEIELVQLDLDIGDITLCDVLRNFNTLFPENCRARYEIRDGHKVYAIICKSDYLQPLHAIVLLIGHDPTINCESKNYLVLSIDEMDIIDEAKINKLNNDITRYLVDTIMPYVPEFEKFYCKYIYNDYEDLNR